MALDKVSIKVDKANIKASVMDKTASNTKFQKAMEESITGENKNQPEIFDLNQYNKIESNNEKEKVTSQLNLSEYKKELKSLGLREEDIDKVTSGKQTIEQLMEEIENDKDTSRKKEVMSATYLKQFGYEYSSMRELKEQENYKARKLEELKEEKKSIESNREYEDIMSIIVRIQNGEKLDYVLKNEVVAWECTDSEGNIEYIYEDPSTQPNYDGTKKYRAILFEEKYPNNSSINKLREVLENNDGRWTNSEEQSNYIKEFENSLGTIKRENDKRKEEIEKEIEKTYNEEERCKSTYEYITKEVDYYIENVDKYIKDDTIMNNTEYENKGERKIEDILDISNYESDGTVLQYKGKEPHKIKYITDSSGVNVEINDKEELTLIIYTMLNERGGIEDDGIHLTKEYNGVRINITSNDAMLNHYREWKEQMTDKEKEIFNGKYNAEGYESAYKYLEDISNELDNRWLAKKTQEDQEFATNHPALASIGSVIKTPFEGISAACHTLNAYMAGENIKRTDIYSAGDVWRNEVSGLVAGTYGEGWSFVYNTGMSMADTGGLIATSALTGGGTATTAVLSSSLMGSRVYVSTLNEAKDRGLEDGEAVLLAASAALTESAMESYSAGHLFNLEEKLGEGVAESTAKLANSISNKSLSNVISKGYYLVGGAVSQGICEGEEELATEIVNYVTDRFVSKDLSNYEQSISKYLKLGYTENEALAATMKDFSGQAGQAFLGGMLSGACFGTFGGAKTIQNTSNNMAINMIKKYEGKNKSIQESLSEDNIAVKEDSKIKSNDKTYADKAEKVDKKGQIKLDTEGIKKYNEYQEYQNLLERCTNRLNNTQIYPGFDEILINKTNLVKAAIMIPGSIVSSTTRYFYKSLNKDVDVLNSCVKNGLYHLTTEKAATKILESGYIKKSKGFLTNYGKSRTFLFNGIPSVEDVCTNCKLQEKYVAIKLNPDVETLQDSKFTYRDKSDGAIAYEGDVVLENKNADIKYLILVSEDGELKYKEVSKDVYDNYEINDSKVFANKVNQKIADTVMGLAGEFNHLSDQITGKNNNHSRIRITDEDSKVASIDNKLEIGNDIKANEPIYSAPIYEMFNEQATDIIDNGCIPQYRVSDEFKPYYKLDDLLKSKFQKQIGKVLVVSPTQEGLDFLLNNTFEQVNQINNSSHQKILLTDALLISNLKNEAVNSLVYSTASKQCREYGGYIIAIDSKKADQVTIKHEFGHLKSAIINREAYGMIFEKIKDILPQIQDTEKAQYLYDFYKNRVYPTLNKFYDNYSYWARSISKKELNYSSIDFDGMTQLQLNEIHEKLTEKTIKHMREAGVGSVFDIYDALYGGKVFEDFHRGHGVEYYSDINCVCEELIAQYTVLIESGAIENLRSILPANITETMEKVISNINSKINSNKLVNEALATGDIKTIIENISSMSENEKVIAVNEAVDNLLANNRIEDAYNIAAQTNEEFALIKISQSAIKMSELMLKQGDFFNAMEMLKRSQNCDAKNIIYNKMCQKARKEIYKALNIGDIKTAESIANIVKNSNLTSEVTIYKEAISGDCEVAISAAKLCGSQGILNNITSIIKDRARREYKNRNYELASTLAASINYERLQRKINRKLSKIGSKMTRVEIKNIDETSNFQQQQWQIPNNQEQVQQIAPIQQKSGPEKDSFVVLSDMHGANWVMDKVKNKYLSQYETIYNLGDIIDRGDNPFNILIDYMELSKQDPQKVVYIPGNHDTFLYGFYRAPNEQVRSMYKRMIELNKLGKTYEAAERLRMQNPQKFEEILNWLGNQPLQRKIIKGGKKYALAHAFFNETLYNMNPNYSLANYVNEVNPANTNNRVGNILWFRKNKQGHDYYNPADLPSLDTTMIIGHTANANNLDLNGVRVIDVDGAAHKVNSDGSYTTRKYTGGDDYEVTVTLDDNSQEVAIANNFIANYQNMNSDQNYVINRVYTEPMMLDIKDIFKIGNNISKKDILKFNETIEKKEDLIKKLDQLRKQIKTEISDHLISARKPTWLTFDEDFDFSSVKNGIGNVDISVQQNILDMCNKGKELEQQFIELEKLEKELIDLNVKKEIRISKKVYKELKKEFSNFSSDEIRTIEQIICNDNFVYMPLSVKEGLRNHIEKIELEVLDRQIYSMDSKAINMIKELINDAKKDPKRIIKDAKIYNPDTNLSSESIYDKISGIQIASNTSEGIDLLKDYITTLVEEYKDNEAAMFFIRKLADRKEVILTNIDFVDNGKKDYAGAYHCEDKIYLGNEVLRNKKFGTFFHEIGHLFDYKYDDFTFVQKRIEQIISEMPEIDFKNETSSINKKELFKKIIDNRDRIEKGIHKILRKMKTQIEQEVYDRIELEIPNFNYYKKQEQKSIFNELENMVYLEYFRKIYRETGYPAVEDIADALTIGELGDNYRIYGHGSKYFGKGGYSITTEIIADFSDLYNNDNINLLDEFFPKEFKEKLTNVYEELIGMAKNISE